MIITVTMNPSIDMSYTLDDFTLDTTNRTAQVLKTAGGKGINVARVIHQLEEEVLATGITGGFLGQFLEHELERDGIPNDFSHSTQETRNCVAILHDGKQTEILEAGPVFSKEEAATFVKHFDSLLDKASIVTISGSLARGLDTNFYSQLLTLAKEKGVKVIVDTSGKALVETLKGDVKPYLIKPNQEEISALLQKPVAEDLDVLRQDLKDPLFEGVEWIVVSLGAKGAFVKHQDIFYKATIPTIPVKNPVGSGDSTVAGLAVALNHQKTPEEVIKTAMTTGMLNTMEEKTGWINKDLFDTYYNQVEVHRV